MTIKGEVTRFCKTTSMKGIPRAVNAENICIRITWIIAVCSMLTLATYQVRLLATEYTSYPYYTIITENIFQIDVDMPVLPALTLCNENPFSSLKPSVSQYGIPTLEQYYGLIDQLTQCPGCNLTMLQNMATLKRLTRNKNAYFQTIGQEGAYLVGHDLKNLMISCNELVYIGNTYLYRPCTELINFTLSPDADYYNCYRVNLPNDYPTKTYGLVAGVSLVLYLDNVNPNDLDIGSNVSRIRNSATSVSKFGVIATTTHQKGRPYPALDGILLPAGISAKLQLFLDKHTRLEPPWGYCQPTSVEGYEVVKMCLSDCYQDHIQRKCNCTDSRMVLHMENETYPFCLKGSLGSSKVVSNYICATTTLNVETINSCIEGCPQPCKEIEYTTDNSFSKWPNPSSMKVFYQSYIQGRDFESYFTVVKQVITGNCSSEMDCSVKYLMAQKMIDDNFLELNYHLSDIRYSVTTENPKIGVADFCSKLGGILNLWAGITVVLLLEFAELLGRIVLAQVKKDKDGDRSSLNVNVIKVAPKREIENNNPDGFGTIFGGVEYGVHGRKHEEINPDDSVKRMNSSVSSVHRRL